MDSPHLYIQQPILSSQKLITKGKEYSYLSRWLGDCMFLTTGKPRPFIPCDSDIIPFFLKMYDTRNQACDGGAVADC